MPGTAVDLHFLDGMAWVALAATLRRTAADDAALGHSVVIERARQMCPQTRTSREA